MFRLGGVVMCVDLGTKLHLFHDNVHGLPPRLLALHVLLVLMLRVVHDPAYRGVRVRSDLDKVEVVSTGELQRVGKRLNAFLLPVGSDQTYGRSTYLLVDPGFCCGYFRTTPSPTRLRVMKFLGL